MADSLNSATQAYWLEPPRVEESWMQVLGPEFQKHENDYFQKLWRYIAEQRRQGTIYPPQDEVFAWTFACPVEKVKVIIVGQDPYHEPGQAHGLAFSVLPEAPIPPSLRNIFQELAKDIMGFVAPQHGNLMGWARQGVLLLNSVLTVQDGNANSHKGKGWEKFTDAVISLFNNNAEGIVFVLWGNYAQAKGAQIDKTRHCVIEGAHPSFFSANKGFFGSKPFSACNKYLSEHDKGQINWCYLPEHI